MYLIDIEKLEYEPFLLESGETIDYISAENLRKAPKVDPVKHAKWVAELHRWGDGDMSIYHNCSHCGTRGAIKMVPEKAWETYYKDEYVPKLSKYCPECGYRMDQRELEDLYEQYKHEWCESRGYILKVVEEKGGINGECYACFDEWYDNEYRELRG